MLASIVIIVCSSVLLIYWFRYSCMLLLRNRIEEAASVRTGAEGFSFPGVMAALKTASALAPLERSLQRDYDVLIYLIEHASGMALESFEDRLLVLDYKVMRLWYGVTRIALPGQARQALSEMASILSVLSQRLERTTA